MQTFFVCFALFCFQSKPFKDELEHFYKGQLMQYGNLLVEKITRMEMIMILF